jgi:hypothetical protein
LKNILGTVCIVGLIAGLSGCSNSIESECKKQADDPANGRVVLSMVGGRDAYIEGCVAGAKLYEDMK